MMISRVVVGAGNARRVFQQMPGREARIESAKAIKRFLFPDNGSYHKARRRGEKALALSGGAN